VQDFLDQQFANGFAAFHGAEVRGSLPIREAVLNDLAERERNRVSGPMFRLESFSIHEGNVIRPNLEIGRSPFSKRLSPSLQVEQPTGLPGRPVVAIRLPDAYSALLGRIIRANLAQAGGFVSFAEGAVWISIRDLVAARHGAEAAALVDSVKSLAIRSQRGTLWVDFEIAVD
jgi:hypothetical protein